MGDAKGEAQPILDTIVEAATRLSEARFCILWHYDGALVHHCASHGFDAENMKSYVASYPATMSEEGILCSVYETQKPVRIRSGFSLFG